MPDLVYLNYWKRKQLLKTPPAFSLRKWWPTECLSEIETIYLEAIRSARSLLDVGAGDLRMQRKLQAAGFQGTYHTQDVGTEFSYTYQSLDDIEQPYEAILCLDVLEHLPLVDGLPFLHRLVELLEPGGVLILQTPNARCIRHPLSWDMTHLHIYNLPDLWAYLQALGLETTGYRVWFVPERRTIGWWLRANLSRYLITRVGCDYADNIALVVRKTQQRKPSTTRD